MTEEIKYIIKVDDKGAVAGIEKFTDAVKKSDDTTRSSSSSMIGNFVKVAGAVGAIKLAYEGLQYVFEQNKIGEALIKQETAFKNLATSAGVSSKHLTEELSKVSKGMVANSELIKSAGTAMMLGIPADKLTELMKIAEATSRQTGQTVTEAFADITLAVGRGSKMILDNLGIIVDVDKANKEYATTLGKTSEQLTDAEKKQAFLNATLKGGNELVEKIVGTDGDKGYRGASKFAAEWKNAQDNLAKTITESSNPLFEAMSKVLKMINDEYDRGVKSINAYAEALKNLSDQELEAEEKKLLNPTFFGGEGSMPDYDITSMRSVENEKKRRAALRLKSDTSKTGSLDMGGLYPERARLTETNEDILRSEGRRGVVSWETQQAQAKLVTDELKKQDELNKKIQKEKEDGIKQFTEMSVKLYGTAYDIEIQKQEEIIALLIKKGSITKQQGEEYLVGVKKKYYSVDSRFGGGLDEAEMENDRMILEYREQVKEAKKWEAQIASINASVTGDRKAMMTAELAILASEEKPLNMSIEMWEKLGEAKRKAIEIRYQSEWEKWANSAKTSLEQLEAAAISAMESFSSGITDAFFEFADGTKSAKDAFLDFASSFLKEIAKMIMQQTILNALKSSSQSGGWMGAIGAMFGAGATAANGAIFEGGFKEFANGGTVSKPTLGLIGEGRYNEAIVPLPDGKSIPVQMQGGGGGMNITVNMNNPVSTADDARMKGKLIAQEIKAQIDRRMMFQRKPGGILNPQPVM